MSIPFSKARDPKLGLLDKLTFGKFKDCRVCDIVQDHYEYLIWASKQGFVEFQKEVIDLIAEQAHFERFKAPEEPKVLDVYTYMMNYSDFEEDVPF